MTAPREEADEDERSVRERAWRLAIRILGWLRDFNRGYARTGHLPYRKK